MHAYITDEPGKPFFAMVPARAAAKPNLKLLFAVTSAPGSFLARQGGNSIGFFFALVSA